MENADIAASGTVSSPSDVLQRIRDNVLGENTLFPTPFGTQRLVYCDYVASGRALNFVEDFVRESILPLCMLGSMSNTQDANFID